VYVRVLMAFGGGGKIIDEGLAQVVVGISWQVAANVVVQLSASE
jgi:hypothetical protein